MATVTITSTPERLLRFARQLEAVANEASGTITITIDNAVANSIGSVTGPSGKRRDS